MVLRWYFYGGGGLGDRSNSQNSLKVGCLRPLFNITGVADDSKEGMSPNQRGEINDLLSILLVTMVSVEE